MSLINKTVFDTIETPKIKTLEDVQPFIENLITQLNTMSEKMNSLNKINSGVTKNIQLDNGTILFFENGILVR